MRHLLTLAMAILFSVTAPLIAAGEIKEKQSDDAEFANAIESNEVRNVADYLKAYPGGRNYQKAIDYIQENRMGYVDDERGIVVQVFEFGTRDTLKVFKRNVLTADGTKREYDSEVPSSGKVFVLGTVIIYIYKEPLSISQDQIVVEGQDGASELKWWKFERAWLAERLIGFSKADDRKTVSIEDEDRIGFLLECPKKGLDGSLFKVAGIPLATVGALREKLSKE